MPRRRRHTVSGYDRMEEVPDNAPPRKKPTPTQRIQKLVDFATVAEEPHEKVAVEDGDDEDHEESDMEEENDMEEKNDMEEENDMAENDMEEEDNYRLDIPDDSDAYAPPRLPSSPSSSSAAAALPNSMPDVVWSCNACTGHNEPMEAECSFCGTPRGEQHPSRAQKRLWRAIS
jgi:hypothetical protein